jgi:membrane fusion protein (multidrug efflux system)
VLLVIGLLALLAALAWGIHWWVSGRFIESTDDAYLQADSTVVAPKVAGYVAEVYVKSNQYVKKGDPLVRLDNRQYQAQLDQAQAAIEARRADLDRALADIKQEQVQIKLAELNLRHAQQEVDRYVPLDMTGAATSEKMAELRHNRDQAKANLEAAQSRLISNTAQIEQARAQIKAGQASLRQTDLDVNDTVVRAAIDGRVGDNTVRVGQFAQPGTRMMTIVPVQEIYLTANFKETQIARMRIGQPADVHVDALPDLDLHGVIDSFSPGTGSQFALLPPENATGNFTKIVQRVPVRIRLQADAATRDRLLPGLSVTVEVDTKHEGEDSRRATQQNPQQGRQESQRG